MKQHLVARPVVFCGVYVNVVFPADRTSGAAAWKAARYPFQSKGPTNIMTELLVSMDFICCVCGQDVGITVKCEGKGLAAGRQAVAAVNIPCPHCQTVNRVSFEPSGTVRTVRPCWTSWQALEPSLN
jgi:hypothetical protein